jgi:hypothetical protein
MKPLMTTNSVRDPARQNQMDESALSAMLDGELGDEATLAILKRVSQGGAERHRFREYCMIGDALRGLDHDIPDLTDRVMAALKSEPTLLAPMPKPGKHRPALWLAAATVAAITWGLWNAGPRDEALAPLAANPNANLAATDIQPGNVMPYLAAHQDFAQAVVSPSEMQFTKVTLAGANR